MNPSNKKFVDDESNKHPFLRFNQALLNILKVSVGNNEYNLTKDDRRQIISTTFIKTGNAGALLLPLWKMNCNDKNSAGKCQNFWEQEKQIALRKAQEQQAYHL